MILLFLLMPPTSMLQLCNVKGDRGLVLTSDGVVTVHFIDVGQGDSIFIDTSNLDVLVDGGTQASGITVLNYLANQNITRVDLMVASHMDEDHIGGLSVILASSIQVGVVLVNGMAANTATYTSFIDLAQNHTMIITHRGQTYVLTQTANLTILNPTQPLQFTNQNDNSIVMRLQIGETSFLLTGDAGADAEQSMLSAGLTLQSDVLKVAHHGSRYGTTTQFLDNVMPSYAIISAGKNNPYGDPSQETIQRLMAHGVTIYGTFESGTIVATSDGTLITFQDTPKPVPEFPPIAIPLTIVAVMLLVVKAKRRERFRARMKRKCSHFWL